ncbi:MAG: TRAP transporter permease [Spirochaetes bacterium]|nr:TRAP transporter permease [Spirochaetota bacterium]MBP8991125.1 TRAP transporter permease [Spirochaetota bacterium]
MSDSQNQDIQKIMEKVDRESAHRNLTGIQGKIIFLLCIILSLFQILNIFNVFKIDAHQTRAVHLAFILLLVYLLYPISKKSRRDRIAIIDLILAIVSFTIMFYIIVFYKQLVMRAGITTTLDYIVGGLAILLILEAARRIIGLPMVIIAIIFILYALFGENMPNLIAHKNVTPKQLVNHLFFTTEGIFGIPVGVSSTFLFMFLLFAAFIEKTGVGKLFIDIGNAVAGWASGGPAKVAIVTSALEGMVEGSSVSNVVGSGSFTIPMMKKLGYKPEFAGAVEASASTGGQIMPPIMGAAAFLMAEFLGIKYTDVVKSAIIPAILYFVGVFMGVHFEAKKLGLKGTPRDQLPKFSYILIQEGHLLLPLIAIIYLLVSGFSLQFVALGSIIIAIVASFFRKSTRISLKDFFEALEKGARSALGVATACATAGIIVGVVTKTGLGLKLASALIVIASNLAVSIGGVIQSVRSFFYNLVGVTYSANPEMLISSLKIIFTLFMAMLTSIILGMGVPTTANYIITSTIAAPALLLLSVKPIAAHMFVFYFGIIADITPPVALAAYAGAAIAKADPFKTGVTATRLSIGAFIVPYMFVLAPQLLLLGGSFWHIILSIITSIIGMTAVSASLTGYFFKNLNSWQRVILFIAGIMLIDPGITTDIIGIVIIAAIYLNQVFLAKRVIIKKS